MSDNAFGSHSPDEPRPVRAPDADSQQNLVAALAPFWSSRKVMDELGIRTRKALASRRHSGDVLGLKMRDGLLLYPVFQFMTTSVGTVVRPGLKPLLVQLRRHDPWAVALVICTPTEALGGQSPLQWIRADRNPEALVSFAEVIDAEWSR
jgi:hypothetical protein